jgi:hypothetical protein
MAQTLDCSLKSLQIPGLVSYTPTFGTKKVDGHGLTTAEINRNIMMPFMKQRPISGVPTAEGLDPPIGVIDTDTIATPIEYDANFAVNQGVKLQLANPAYEGQTIKVVASFSSGTPAEIKLGVTGNPEKVLLNKEEMLLFFAVNGKWQQFTITLSSAKKYTDELLIKIFQNGYIQWPGMPTPDTLFTFEGYRWAEVNYDGCFFRAKGKGAHPFGGEEQGDAIRNIKGFLGIEGTLNFSAPFYKETPARQNVDAWQGYFEAYKRDEMGFDAGLVVPTAEENRPRNRTFIIWKLEKIEE